MRLSGAAGRTVAVSGLAASPWAAENCARGSIAFLPGPPGCAALRWQSGTSTMPSPLLDQVRADAAAHGLNLFGLVDRQRFDAGERVERRAGQLARECGTILV
ncbi:MAG: hypothetical protein WBO45_11120, partial [Planctomycetota bacterium]